VYRVNWLHAKARVARWIEEKKIVSNEMIWTINSFAYNRDQWKRQIEAHPDEPGLRAYAEKQVELWENFAVHGAEMFD
ncbi:hypothetical protein B0H13DRAFT_1537508, partial [Mycena leptocephala]